jgi:hypothetical protein
MRSFPGILMTCLFSFLFHFLLNAQQTGFSNTMQCQTTELMGYSMIRTFTNDYLIAAGTDNGYNISLPVAMKIDQTGNIIWSREYNVFNFGFFNCITLTSDSNFMLAGQCYNPGTSSYDVLCVKLDPAGDTIWSKAIDLGSNEMATSVHETRDKGFIITGRLTYPYDRIFIIKLHSDGNLAWSKIIDIGTHFQELIFSAVENPDSSFHVVAIANKNDYSPPGELILMRISKSGNAAGPTFWSERQGLNYVDAPGADLLPVEGGSVVLCSLPGKIFAILKIDYLGHKVWSKYFDGDYYGYYDRYATTRLHRTLDHGFVFVIPSDNYGQLCKTDSTGNLLWKKDLAMIAVDVSEMQDSGFLILGNTAVWESPHVMGIVRTDRNGNSSSCVYPKDGTSNNYGINFVSMTYATSASGSSSPVHPELADLTITEDSGCVVTTGIPGHDKSNRNEFTIFPNPTSGTFTLNLVGNAAKTFEYVEIYSMSGKRIYRSSDPATLHVPIDLNPLPGGIYFIRAVLKERILSQKLLILN